MTAETNATSGSKSGDHIDPEPLDYTLEEVGQSVFDLSARYATVEKGLMRQQFELESFTRRQDATIKRIEDSLDKLMAANINRPKDHPATATTHQFERGWQIPRSLVNPPPGVDPDTLPRIKPDAPRFNGEHATDWIRGIQKYYNHHYTPLHDRLYLTTYLFDYPASSWLTYWEDNCSDKTWDDFLLAVKHRFDPDLFVDYVGILATLRQTSSAAAYQTAFEEAMQKAPNVGDETLLSLFIAGLHDDLKNELMTRRPHWLNEAFALAQWLAACRAISSASTTTARLPWQQRDSRPKEPQPQ